MGGVPAGRVPNVETCSPANLEAPLGLLVLGPEPLDIVTPCVRPLQGWIYSCGCMVIDEEGEAPFGYNLLRRQHEGPVHPQGIIGKLLHIVGASAKRWRVTPEAQRIIEYEYQWALQQ